MGTVFSNQSPQKLFDHISSTLKANKKYISIDLNEHFIPNHKAYDTEHYINQSKYQDRRSEYYLLPKNFCKAITNLFSDVACSIYQINALMSMPAELQAKKVAEIQKTLKASRGKVSSMDKEKIRAILTCEYY